MPEKLATSSWMAAKMWSCQRGSSGAQTCSAALQQTSCSCLSAALALTSGVHCLPHVLCLMLEHGILLSQSLLQGPSAWALECSMSISRVFSAFFEQHVWFPNECRMAWVAWGVACSYCSATSGIAGLLDNRRSWWWTTS
jgi:hypothetical protein